MPGHTVRRVQRTGSGIGSSTPGPGLCHRGEPAPSFSQSTRPPHLPAERKQRPPTPCPPSRTRTPGSCPSGSLRIVAYKALPGCKPDTLGALLGAICLVSLGLCEESNFDEAAGTTWRGQLPHHHHRPEQQARQGQGSLPGRPEGGQWQTPSASAPNGLKTSGDIWSPSCYALPVDSLTPEPGPVTRTAGQSYRGDPNHVSPPTLRVGGGGYTSGAEACGNWKL